MSHASYGSVLLNSCYPRSNYPRLEKSVRLPSVRGLLTLPIHHDITEGGHRILNPSPTFLLRRILTVAIAVAFSRWISTNPTQILPEVPCQECQESASSTDLLIQRRSNCFTSPVVRTRFFKPIFTTLPSHLFLCRILSSKGAGLRIEMITWR